VNSPEKLIFASTGGIHNKPAAETARDFSQHGISAVELSGGTHSATQEADLVALRKNIVFQVHNYFPPAAQPFVFNLASTDPILSGRSVEHVRSAMRLSVVLGRPVYSFHAGFRIDPRVSDLGQTIRPQAMCDRATALRQFGEKMLLLAEEAHREGVTLLIENNVLSAANMKTFGEDPLLLTHPDEIVSFMKAMPANVGLLLDLAHLKVSARTLNFNPVAAHAQVKRWIQGYHLSDNDGLTDSNQIVTADSWFWKVIEPGLNYYSLEVYKTSSAELARQCEYVKTRLSGYKVAS
jgi:sugar phosphate isomerase/epimerase